MRMPQSYPQSLIDIYVPTYEPNLAFLKAAVDSALAQTETRWRMLIHDDCSKVDVRAMVEPYLNDARITFERSTTRLGIGGNWNACLKQSVISSGDEKRHVPFTQFLFQDDVWAPTYLASMMNALEKNPSAGFASGDHAYDCTESPEAAPLYAKVTDARNGIAAGTHNGKELLKQWIDRELHPNIIGEPSFVMMRRSLIEKVGPFREDMPQFLDVDYWLRCLMQSDWVHVTENVGSFRVHGGGASAQNQASGAGIYDRLRCFQMLIGSLPHDATRKSAIEARNRALEDMAGKFLKRMGNKQSIPARGAGGMSAFALRHPWLVMRALMRAKKNAL
jgi:GT2 family glycosyltransferase